MARLTWRRIGAVAVGLGFLSWVLNALVLRSGFSPLPVPATVSVVLLAASGLALWFGWAVREYRAGRRPLLDPMRAARTAMFSQAAALAGAALMGGYGGYALALSSDWDHPPRRALIVGAFVAVAAAGVLLACGWVAERWCATSGGDDDKPPRAARSTAPGTSPEAA